MKEININKLKTLGFKDIETSYIGKVNDYFFSITEKQDEENQHLFL